MSERHDEGREAAAGPCTDRELEHRRSCLVSDPRARDGERCGCGDTLELAEREHEAADEDGGYAVTCRTWSWCEVKGTYDRTYESEITSKGVSTFEMMTDACVEV